MARQPMIEREERNNNIVDDFVHGGLTKAAIAEKYKISSKHVYNILEAKGLSEGDRKVPVKRNTDGEKRPLSMLHAQLGAMVSNYRVFDLEMGIEQFAIRLGMSDRRLSDIERGLRHADLSDLEALSREMGKPIHELLKPRFEKA